MAKKRRSNGDHNVGESAPGTVGDAEGQDETDSPMDRIHKRRHGDVSAPEPSDGYKSDDEHNNESENASDNEGGVDEFGIPVNFKTNSDADSE